MMKRKGRGFAVTAKSGFRTFRRNGVSRVTRIPESMASIHLTN